MRPEDRLLLICSRSDFEDEHHQKVLCLTRQHRLDWEAIGRAAAPNGIAPLVYANLAACPAVTPGVPLSVLTRFRSLFAQNLVQKERQANRLAQALGLLNACGIDSMLIKGAALDMLVYSPRPYTTSNDVDLVLRVRREELSQAEWRAIKTVPRGIEYDFFEHHDLTINGILAIDFHRIWGEARAGDYRGQRVLLMCPEDLLIAACINACRHRFLRLKHVCDIAEITRSFPSLNWENIIEKARAQGCGNIVYLALRLTQQTLGCQFPATLLDDLVIHSARRVFIELTGSLFLRTSMTASGAGMRRADGRVWLSRLLPYAAYDRRQLRRKLAWFRTWR
jgi:hypothetical protein